MCNLVRSQKIGVANFPLRLLISRFQSCYFADAVKFKLMLGGCRERAVQSNETTGRKRRN